MFRFFHALIVLTLLFTSVGWQPPANTAAQPPVNVRQSLQDLPASAQAVVSAAIGQDIPAFAVTATGSAYRSDNLNGVQSSFSPEAAVLEAGGLRWDMRLRAWGRGTDLSVPGLPALATDGNRIEYRYAALTEWYVNGPAGLQQGFTLAQSPKSVSSGTLAFALSLGGYAAQLDDDRLGVTLSSAAGSLLYRGLRAVDAAGKALPAWMEIMGAQDEPQMLIMRVDDSGATYPLVVDPLVTYGKISATDAPDDSFGTSVALNEQGDLAAVGAMTADEGGHANQGVVYIFSAANHVWSMQARIAEESGLPDDNFGSAVDLSSDGNTLLVGASNADIAANTDQGAAYVYVYRDGAWTRQGTLLGGSGSAHDYMGSSVALSADGSTALVGAVGSRSWGGSAYVFARSGTTWSQQGWLYRSTGDFAAGAPRQGGSVALSADGSLAMLGAYNADIAGKVRQGAAITFLRTGEIWEYQATLTVDDGQADDQFGRSVALSANATTALIGAYTVHVGGKADQGAAYIFTRSGITWTKQAKLTASDGAAYDMFGGSGCLTSNGDVAYVGVSWSDVDGRYDQGAVYTFARGSSAAQWSQVDRTVDAGGAAGDKYGVSVAVGSTTLLIGANSADVNGSVDQGASFVIMPGQGSPMVIKLTGTGEKDALFGMDVAMSEDGATAVVGALYADVNGEANQGAAYVFTRNQYGVFEQRARLVASDGAANDHFGRSVAISDDGTTVLVGAYSHGTSDYGAAYVFVFSPQSQTWSEQQKLVAKTQGVNDYFGYSVSLSSNGNMALIGASQADVAGNNEAGKAEAYYRSGTSWAWVDTMEGPAAGGQFGTSVAISGDGNTALVGAPYESPAGLTDAGAAYVYILSNQQFELQRAAKGGAAYIYFGWAVSLSYDGNDALVGSPGATVSGMASCGEVNFYHRTDTSWGYRGAMVGESASDQLGNDVALSRDGKTAVVGAPTANRTAAGPSTGAIYFYEYDGTQWRFVQKIVDPNGVQNDMFGIAVSLGGGGRIVFAGAPYDTFGENTNQGSAFWYTVPRMVYLPLLMR